MTRTYDASLLPPATWGGQCRLCPRHTWNDKPFCTEHVQHGDYAATVLDQLAAMHGEVARVARFGWTEVDVHGLLAGEMLRVIGWLGPTHKGGLVKELKQFVGKRQQVVLEYGEALVQAGLAKWTIGDRGTRLARADWEG